MVYFRIVRLLQQRGLVVDVSRPQSIPFELADKGDGVVFIQAWDEAALGPQPTLADIAAIPDAEAIALQEEHHASRSGVSSRDPQRLASIAWALRLKDPQAWGALSLDQKKAAVLAEADRWRDMRVWIEKRF